MRRILAAAVLLAFMPTAQAAPEKAKAADMTTNAEFRVRYMYTQNASGNKDAQPGTLNDFEHRAKIGMGFRANEKFSAGFSLLHNAYWGQSDPGVTGSGTGDSANGINDGTDNAENMVLVHEAYGTWMAADDLSLKFGRQTFAFGDGSVMDVNDWERVPYAFEGLSANYEMEMGTVKAWAFQMAQFTGVSGGAYGSSGSSESDPHHNTYGLSFDVKGMPEMIKVANIHVIKDNKATTPGSSTQNGLDALRYGATVGVGMSAMDAKVTYARHEGDTIAQTTNGGATTKSDREGEMWNIDLGYTMEAMMNMRIGAFFHKDSANYDKYFAELHENSGMMDLVEWGNLTYYGLQVTMSPMDSTTAGLSFHMMKKTDEGTGVTIGNDSHFSGAPAAEEDLGNQINLWAEHKYDGGFSAVARVGHFMPGDAFKNDATATNPGPDAGDAITQFWVQGKFTF